MRLLIDVNAGKAVAEAARALGHNVVSVFDRDRGTVDEDILAWAVSDGRLVVTMDKDFGELVVRDGLPHAGVLLMRMDDARRAERVAAVTTVLVTYGEQLIGQFAVHQHGQTRFH